MTLRDKQLVDAEVAKQRNIVEESQRQQHRLDRQTWKKTKKENIKISNNMIVSMCSNKTLIK
jgi:hypothetical protein